MSVSPKGQYTNFVVFDEAKRYFVLQAQRNKPLLDEEVRELNQSLLAQVTRLTTSLMGDVASPLETYSTPPGNSGPNNAFKVVQSSVDPINNFKVTGGAGIDDPAILYLDGYRLFLKGDLEYNAQSAVLLPGESLSDAMKRDNYTTTPIPSLTTPGSDRIDVVYVDLSFAEVTADIAGSEYTDPGIKDPVIGSSTANRLRAVIDVQVAQGWTGATDATIFQDSFFDPSVSNQVQHFKCPIALIRRPSLQNLILDSMVTDLLSLHDLRVLTPKEITHRTRHGGYTQTDVTAGRANQSDVSETWGATGRNEGLDTEAFNTSSVTPRVIDKDGKYKVTGIVVGGSTGTIQPDAELLVTGEAVAETLYGNRVTAGYGQPFTGARGETGGIVQASSVGLQGSAFFGRASASGEAIVVQDGVTGGTVNFQTLGSGRTGIKTGATGPLTDFDVGGSASIYADLGVNRDLSVLRHLGVSGTSHLDGLVTVGGSGMSVLGDLGVTGKTHLEGLVTIGYSGASVSGDLSVLGQSTLTGFVAVGGSGMSVLGDLGVTGQTHLEGFVTVGFSGMAVNGSLGVTGQTHLEGFVTVGASGLQSAGSATIQRDLAVSRDASVGRDADISNTLTVHGHSFLEADVSVSGALSVDGSSLFGDSIGGNDWNIPGGQLSSSNPAVFGNVSAFQTSDPQNSVQADRGFYAEGATGAWGSFVGGSSGTVGFKIGAGNSVPGMGVVRGWNRASLTLVTKNNLIKGAVAVVDDPTGNGVFVGIGDNTAVNPRSVAWVSKLSGETRMMAYGIRSLTSMVADANGTLWATAGTNSMDNYGKLYKMVPDYGPDGTPDLLSVEPQDLSEAIGAAVGVTIAKTAMTFFGGAYTVQAGTPIVMWKDVATDKGQIIAVDVNSANFVQPLLDIRSAGRALTNGTLGTSGTPKIYYMVGDGASAPYADPSGIHSIDPVTGSPVAEGTAGTLLLNANAMHFGTDGLIYLSAQGYVPGSGKIWRVGPGNIYEIMYQGIDHSGGITTDANRTMYLTEPLGYLHRKPLPGSVVVHMDKPTVASPYAFPGDVVLVADAREASIETFNAEVLSVHADAFKVDAALVAQQDAFFGKDVYVSGRIHQDDFATGEVSAGAIVVGATGAVNDLDVWGDAVVSHVLVVGAHPDSTVVAAAVHKQTSVSGTTVGNDVVGYAFGEFQAYDYRAIGQQSALGIYSVESQDGHMAAWLGGDAVAPYNGATGVSGGSGLSGRGRTVGMHLIEADTLVVDKNAGADAAFMQVMGDLEVVRELTVRSIHHSAIGPEGVKIRQSGTVTEDKTRMLVKDFAMNTPVKLRGFDATIHADGAQSGANLGRWCNNSRGPQGVTGAPCIIDPSAGIDSILLGTLGTITMEWKAATVSPISVNNGLRHSSDLAFNTLVSYKFSSPVLGDQDWLGSASFYPSVVSIRADIVERGGAKGYAESCHVQKSFQVYIDPRAWKADLGSPQPDPLLGSLYTYRPFLSPFSASYADTFPFSLQNSVNRAWTARDTAISAEGDSLVHDSGTAPVYVSSFEFDFSRKESGESGAPTYTTDWLLALLPTFASATKRNLGVSNEFNYVGTWELEVVLVPLKDKWVSNVIGQIQLADAVGTPAWSSTTPPWTQRADLPWVDQAQLFNLVTGDKFVWEQTTLSAVWSITHNLGGYPAVEVLDTSGNVVLADIQYLSPDALTVSFGGVPTVGKAVLN